MSALEDHKRIVRAVLIDGYSKRDLPKMLEHLAPDVEWIPPIASAEGRSFHGHEGVTEWYERLLETFNDFKAEIEDWHPVGASLLTLGRIKSKGKTSGVPLDDPVGWLWDFRDGKIARMQVFRGHKAALEAAGVKGRIRPSV